MISLYRYHKISELAEMLAGIAAGSESPAYMLPSRANEDILLDLICLFRAEGGYFGHRPLVWDWAGMYAALVPRSGLRRQIDPPDHRLILKYIIDRALAELDSLGAEVPKGVRRGGFVDTLSGAVRELLLEDVLPDMLLSGEYGKNSGSDDAKTGKISSVELLYRLYTDYLIYLEDHGLADNSQIPSLIGQCVRRGALSKAVPGRIVWIGFMSLTGSQLKLVRALAALGIDMEFLSPDCGLDSFHDIGEQLGLVGRGASGKPGALLRIAGNTPYEQYDLLADEVARIFYDTGDGEAPPDVGILLPRGGASGVSGSSASLRLMASALRARSVPVQSRAEVSISDTAVIDILRRIWICYEQGWPFAKTFSLLCSPCLSCLNTRRDRQRALETMPEGAEQWLRFFSVRVCDNSSGAANMANAVKMVKMAKNVEIFGRLEEFCAFLNDPDGHTAEELLRALLGLVRGWDAALSAEASEYPDFDEAVREVASATVEISEKIEMLSELTPPLGEAGAVRFSGSTAVGFLVEWSREATAALGSRQRGAVTLYDSHPPVLASHEIWAMTDVDPSHFPGSSAEHLLLDGEVRHGVNSSQIDGIHLPTLHEKREQSEAVFRRLLATGERLTIVSRSLSDAQGRPQGESPFLLSYLAEREGDEKLCPVTEGISRIDSMAPADRGNFPRVAEWRPMDGRKVRVGASHVDEWLRCPFFYWCARLAKLDSPIDVSEVFGRLDRGNLLHEIWRSVWSIYVGDGSYSSVKSLHGVLLSSWEDIIKRLEGSKPLLSDPRSAPVISGLKSKMLGMADIFDEIEKRAAAAGMMRAQTGFEFKLPEYEFDNVVFVGYADRIDFWGGADPTGPTWPIILDYKLGSSDRLRGSMQGACYSAMMRLGGFDVAGYCYAAHGDSKIVGLWRDDLAAFTEIYRKGRGRADAGLDEMMDRALSVMKEMDEAVGIGLFPARYDSPSCPRCAYRTVCRRGERFGVPQRDDEGDF